MQNGGRSGSGVLVLAAMTLANAMILVDQTAVPLTLPDLVKSFSVTSNAGQWVLTASLLPLAGFLVLGGRLGDLLGRRRIFLLGGVVFAGASALAGAAPTFGILLAARVLQGTGGALMLPATVALLSAAYPAESRGRALGLMGGIAGAAGALGPTIGGGLTSALGWRAVLFVNLPLLVLVVLVTLRSVPADGKTDERVHVDVAGALLLCMTLAGVVFGFAQTTAAGWGSWTVLVPLVVAVAAGVGFVVYERRCRDPLLDLHLLRSSPNYLGATISQGVAGMAEMGLGVLLPLVLILNLRMTPALAGLALIATTLPMVVLAPLAGRWYDRVGGRIPLVSGFAVLGLGGALLAAGVLGGSYLALLPGLVLYGAGLAVVLTVNDPVSLDSIPESDSGQASGVSATAEQGGGALGIALLYAVFHTTYVLRLNYIIDTSKLPDLTLSSSNTLRDQLFAAEQTGLDPSTFDPAVRKYLVAARDASEKGYVVAFLAVTVLAVIGAVAVARLVRRPAETTADAS